MDRSDDNNVTVVAGTVESEPILSHEIFGEKFFTFSFHIKRISNYIDNINVLLPERLYPIKNISLGDNYRIKGQFRSHNNQNESGNKLQLNLFVKDIELLISKEPIYENNIKLIGYICKPITYRKTPLGREIADILLAVNRAFNKSDYIPCIAWGRNAKYVGMFSIGTKVTLEGRIQSRLYTKKINEIDILMTAYEVSIFKIEIIDE